MTKTEFAKGLEGVIAAETKICSIDGAQGKLYYRGYHIENLLQEKSFEDISFLLYFGELPTEEQRECFLRCLAATRDVPDAIITVLKRIPKSLHPMEVMQSLVPLFSSIDISSICTTTENSSVKNCTNCWADELALISQVASLTCMLYRVYHDKPIIMPDKTLGHAENMLYMMHGERPSRNETRALDQCLSLHAEHGFNASTFTARVVASTLAPTINAVSAAYGSLYGPLHGGANEKVMQMLADIGSAEAARKWVLQQLEQKNKIMGMGHRVYKTRDPRANAIEILLEAVSEEHKNTTSLSILRTIETTVREVLNDKPIYPNVDFFSGSVYEQLGIPPLFYTPMFGAARVSGWIAHIFEQRSDNRIYRPGALYVGPAPREI